MWMYAVKRVKVALLLQHNALSRSSVYRVTLPLQQHHFQRNKMLVSVETREKLDEFWN